MFANFSMLSQSSLISSYKQDNINISLGPFKKYVTRKGTGGGRLTIKVAICDIRGGSVAKI